MQGGSSARVLPTAAANCCPTHQQSQPDLLLRLLHQQRAYHLQHSPRPHCNCRSFAIFPSLLLGRVAWASALPILFCNQALQCWNLGRLARAAVFATLFAVLETFGRAAALQPCQVCFATKALQRWNFGRSASCNLAKSAVWLARAVSWKA